MFADWIFFGLTVASVFVFRRTMPDAPRPFKTWGYPVTPALFVTGGDRDRRQRDSRQPGAVGDRRRPDARRRAGVLLLEGPARFRFPAPVRMNHSGSLHALGEDAPARHLRSRVQRPLPVTTAELLGDVAAEGRLRHLGANRRGLRAAARGHRRPLRHAGGLRVDRGNGASGANFLACWRCSSPETTR